MRLGKGLTKKLVLFALDVSFLSKGIASVGLGISLIHEIKSSQAIVDDLYAGVPENKR